MGLERRGRRGGREGREIHLEGFWLSREGGDEGIPHLVLWWSKGTNGSQSGFFFLTAGGELSWAFAEGRCGELPGTTAAPSRAQ